MRLSTIRLQFCSIALVLICGVAAPSFAQDFDVTSLSSTCKPCEDFYKYVNQKWLDAHPIPAAYSSWGPWEEVYLRTQQELKDILESSMKSNAKKGSLEQKIGDFYASAMDSVGIERAGITPLKPELQKIASIQSTNEFPQLVAHLHTIGVGAMFDFGGQTDPKNSNLVIGYFWQGGLGLPDRDYYFRTDPRAQKIREAYLEHIANSLKLAHEASSDEDAKAKAQSIMDLETRLANVSMTLVEQRDPDSTYHKMTVAELSKLTPHFDWPSYFRAIGAPQIATPNAEIAIGQPVFMRGMDSLISGRSMNDWKTYFTWHLLTRSERYLDSAFVNEDFNYSKVFRGSKEILPRWQRSVAATDRALGEALGKIYVEKYFPAESKQRMRNLVHNLESAFHDELANLPWIGETTRKNALNKLSTFVDKIGYPDKWRDYSGLVVDRGPYITNILRASKFNYDFDIHKINKAVDRSEWGMTPPTINAYYNPSNNEIVFPAGFLQPPFFDPKKDDAYNYGAVGAVIGHEMTHGFDDEGAKYDAEGNLKNWWTDEDMKNFEERSQCVINQFTGYAVEDTIHLVGAQTVGENIADLGGVTIAYKAYMKSIQGKPRKTIDGFTPEQRFFVGFARMWADNERPEALRSQVNTDFHSPAVFRVLGPLSNFAPFAEAFHCQAGDKMVRPAQCVIW